MNDRYGWDDRDADTPEGRERWRRQSGDDSHRSHHQDDSRGSNSQNRWHSSEDDDWRSRSGLDPANRSQGRSDFDREQRYGSAGTFGYGDGRQSNHGKYGANNRGARDYGARQSYGSQGEGPRRYASSDYGYGAGQQGDAASQQRYFTGQQQAWQVPSTDGAPGAYGGSSQGFGDDYRAHGYGSGPNERGFLQKAGDEIASWFGDEDATRRREADHRGRGPSDYTRSDERIREDANDRLTEDWRVDASLVSVVVEHGEVTLSGTVSRREDKRRAEDIVEDISGVKHVQNNLRVQQTAWSGGSAAAPGIAGLASGNSPGSASAETKDKSNTAPT